MKVTGLTGGSSVVSYGQFFGQILTENASKDWTMKDMINGQDGYPPFVEKPPFKNWEDFKKAVENIFLTEETQHEAIIKI